MIARLALYSVATGVWLAIIAAAFVVGTVAVLPVVAMLWICKTLGLT